MVSTHIFKATIKSKALYNLLKPLVFDTSAYCTINEFGFTVSVQKSKVLEARALISKDFFESFDLEQELLFSFDIKTFCECVGLFVQNDDSKFPTVAEHHVVIEYPRDGGELLMSMIMPDCNTTVTLSLYDPVNDLSICSQFNESEISCSAILKADSLQSTFLEFGESSEIEIQIDDKSFLQISSNGISVDTNVQFSKNSIVLEAFDCACPTKQRYSSNLLKPFTKALGASHKVHLRINERGILALQLMTNDDQALFLEFYIVPLEDRE